MQGRFAAIVGVKDECDLLPHCMAHLARIGVGQVIAIDCGSRDGSLEWLRQHAGEGLRCERYDDRDPDASAWERLNLRLARESGADWVLFQDADEFWIPASGRIADTAGLLDCDALSVHRFNVPLGPHGACLGEGEPPGEANSLSLIVAPVPDFRSRLAADEGLPWIRGVPVPKAMARPGRLAAMSQGGHDVQGSDGVLRRGVAKDLLIAHLPFTSAERFERKLANIRRVFEVHDAYFGEHLAWHWRRWLALPDAAAVRAEFKRQHFDADTLARLRADGVVMSAARWFAREAADGR